MAHLLSRLIQSYKRHGYKIRGGLNPYYFDNPDAPFMTLYRDGEPKSTGAGLAPIEIQILEQILSSLPKAKRILIIGNAFGWSTLAIAMSCPEARVIAIDADIEGTDSGLGRKLTEDIAREEKLDVRVVNALSPRDVASVVREQLDDGPLDFVLIDGLHVNEQLRRDLAAVSPHMSGNGIIVLHDTLSWHMLAAVSEFSESHGYKFQILTRSPSGMAVAYREAQPLTLDIIDSYVDETLDPLEWLASKGGNVAEPGPELLPRLSKGYSTRLFGLAEVYVAEGNWAKVGETLTRMVRENPSNADTAFNAGAFLFDRGRPHDSEVFFVQAQTLAPNWHLPPHQLGRVCRQLGRLEEALEHFSHAVRLNPTWVHSHIEMCAIEIERGNTAKALQHFSSSAILDEVNLSIQAEIIRLHLALGQFFEALNYLIKIQMHAPAAILPWEDLAASLPCGDAGQKAVLAMERLCQQRPDWRGAKKALGIVLRKTGRLNESRNVFENSADQLPGWLGAGVLYELALTCEELGDLDHAKRYLEQALKLRPSFERASKALSRLVEAMCASMGKSQNRGHAAQHSSRIKLILPGQLDDIEYALVGRTDSKDFVEIKRLLAWASPHAKCIVSSEHIINGITNILTEPEEALSLIGGSVTRSGTNCLYLPIPENYPWAYWDVWNWFANTPELLSDLTSFAAFKHMFERCNYLRGGVDTRRLQSWNDAEHLFCYWGHGRARFSEHKSELDFLLSKLADDESTNTMKMVLASSPQTLWQHFVETVFCRADYSPDKWIRQGDTILNLGVFSGHEIPYFYSSAGPKGKLCNIDPLGHDLLGARAQRFCKSAGDNIIEVRMAAGDRHKKGRFGHYSDGQAYLLPDSEDGGRGDIEITPIDIYVEQQNLRAVDFIKIDIEGMDQEALSGLSKTIKKFRPTISVSIYHCEEHMWSIPNSLINNLDDYIFFVDHFSPFRWETIFTAVPIERGKLHKLGSR